MGRGRVLKISELRKLTLLEIARAIREQETSSTEIVEVLLEQIRRTDSKIRAYVTVCGNSATKLAEVGDRQLRSGVDLGPLHGIPVAIKDNFETKGIRTTCGSMLLKDYLPSADCTAVKRLKSAGAIVLGKLNTHEFALGGVTPPTRNPWDINRIPGGSSGGSAAAIASSSAIATIGSDTGGSIRIPASFCGVVGLKPTYGRVSRNGLFPESWSLDHVGPITRRAEDAALMLSIIAGRDDLDPMSSERPVPEYVRVLRNGISGLRIGVPKSYFFDHCDREIRKAVYSAIDVLRTLGCTTDEFEFPHIHEIMAAHRIIDRCESSAYHERTLAEKPNDFAPDVRLLLEEGLLLPATYYIQAMRFRAMVFPKILNIFKRFDVIVTPTEPMVAPKIGVSKVRFGEVEELVSRAVAQYTAQFNLLGLPALSVPCGFSSNGLPIGLQIIGSAYDESSVLRVGFEYERATEWYLRSPKT